MRQIVWAQELHQFHVMSMILKTITARHYWIQILMAFLKHHIITNMQHTESTDRSEEMFIEKLVLT